MRSGARMFRLKVKATQSLIDWLDTSTTKNGPNSMRGCGRDTWLQDGVCFAVHGRWLGETEQAFEDEIQLAKASAVAQQMRTLAGDGDFLIWGKAAAGRLHEIITPQFWVTNQIDIMHLIADSAESVRTEPATSGRSGIRFTELMVNRLQVEQLWPAPISSSHIPLREAARKVFEATERKPYGIHLLRTNATEVERYRTLISALKEYAPLHGKTPPSNVVLPLDRDQARQLWWKEDTDSLVELTNPKNVVFVEVCLKAGDLEKHVRWAEGLTAKNMLRGEA